MRASIVEIFVHPGFFFGSETELLPRSSAMILWNQFEPESLRSPPVSHGPGGVNGLNEEVNSRTTAFLVIGQNNVLYSRRSFSEVFVRYGNLTNAFSHHWLRRHRERIPIIDEKLA